MKCFLNQGPDDKDVPTISEIALRDMFYKSLAKSIVNHR